MHLCEEQYSKQDGSSIVEKNYQSKQLAMFQYLALCESERTQVESKSSCSVWKSDHVDWIYKSAHFPGHPRLFYCSTILRLFFPNSFTYPPFPGYQIRQT